MTGGAGYLGAVLVPKLIAEGHSVVVYDTLQFGAESVKPHASLRVVNADILDIETFAEAVVNSGAVIHLAGVPIEPAADVEPALDKLSEISSFERLVQASRDAGVRRFILASSSSLYGVTTEAEVTEDHPLLPITDDDKLMAACETVLLEHHGSDFTTVILRIADICGVSPRMRFDLSVNHFTNHAVSRGVISAPDSPHKKSHIPIEDISDLYIHLLRAPSRLIAGQVFNVGSENLSPQEIALLVRTAVEKEFPEKGPISIETADSEEFGPCPLSSNKIAEILGWTAQRSIEAAVSDICQAFKQDNFTDSLTDRRFYNIGAIMPMVSV